MTPSEKIKYAEERIRHLQLLIKHWKEHEKKILNIHQSFPLMSLLSQQLQ